jgi:Zn-dependent peptidase ImmA (M78 family)
MKKRIKVGCFTYTIHFVEASSDHGETEPDSKNIYINTKYPVEVQRETLNHEILHVCLNDFPNWNTEIKDAEKAEEDVVRYISPNQVQIYQDNKWIREFVFGKGK